MNQEPRISVIIPVYNGVKYVAEALQSVFGQTYKDYEIIVADDGSTDGSLEVLKPFSDRITILALPHRGVSATRNSAIAQSHGELIALLDSDDIWEPTKLRTQVAYMDQHPEFALTYTYSVNFTGQDEGSVSLPRKMDFEGHIFRDLFTKGCFTNSTIIMRRSAFDAVGGYDETFKAAEDYELNMRMSRAFQIGRVPDVLLRRRIHPDSFYSSGYDSQYLYTLPVYEKLLSDPVVCQEIGIDKNEYLSSFILRFVFKALYDGYPDLSNQKLEALQQYSREKTDFARKLVADNDVSPASWRSLIVEFDTWYDDVKHKAALYKGRRASAA